MPRRKPITKLVLAQVEISAVEQQKILEIEEIRQNLFKATKTALHIITGLNNDLSELLTQYVAAKEEGLRWEKSVTVVKSYMVESEASVNCLLDAINHVYILLRKRRGVTPKAPRGDVETQLDHIKEEIEILHEVRKLAAAKMANDGHSLCAEKGTERRKAAL
ncbi:AGAP003022-PA-like protein [Anopheles sinensis]|uniref:AGAP003022-PA-like protein n=1 Tax=Anopheles sinensis TaxID=74873 RepID=A0A084VRC8_ANOSI|nr:AGAP003022-PA-like protein [Anopheles sinensis]